MKRKPVSDSYGTQKESARKHREFILRALKNEAKLFGELLDLGRNDTEGIKSPTGLSKILDEMEDQGDIDQEATKKDSRDIARKAYRLTNAGEKKVDTLWYISHELDELKRANADHTRYEDLNEILGLHGDIIFNHVSPEITKLVKLNLDNIGRFIASLFADKVKNGELSFSYTDQHQKAIIAIDINFYDVVESLKYGLKLITDLKKGNDILKDKEIMLLEKPPYNIFFLGRTVRYAEVFNDEEFDDLVFKLFKKYNDNNKLKRDFELDLTLVREITNEILKGKNPLITLKEKLDRDERIKNKRSSSLLGSKVKIRDPKSLVYRYTVAAELINYNNKNLVEKIRNYQKTIFEADKHMGHTILFELKTFQPSALKDSNGDKL